MKTFSGKYLKKFSLFFANLNKSRDKFQKTR